MHEGKIPVSTAAVSDRFIRGNLRQRTMWGEKRPAEKGGRETRERKEKETIYRGENTRIFAKRQRGSARGANLLSEAKIMAAGA